MCASEREVHRIVIEGRRRPRHCGMAGRAILREIGSHVIRIRRALEVRHVAGNAGSARKVVVIVGVAIHALPRRHHVCPT